MVPLKDKYPYFDIAVNMKDISHELLLSQREILLVIYRFTQLLLMLPWLFIIFTVLYCFYPNQENLS